MKFDRAFRISALLVLLTGCATAPKVPQRVAAPAEPPKPVQLTPLRDYGSDKSAEADKSAGCYLIPATLGHHNDPLVATMEALLQQGLIERGYTVLEDDRTAEIRRRIQKQITFIDYSTRSKNLPVRKQTACDVYVTLQVQDRPDSATTPPHARYFNVMARNISKKSDPKASLSKAVDNFFCLDSFCKALEPTQRPQ